MKRYSDLHTDIGKAWSIGEVVGDAAVKAIYIETEGLGYGFGEGDPVYAKGVKCPDEVKRWIKWRKAAKQQMPGYRFAIGLRFYVASRLAQAAEVDALTDALKAEGHIHSYRWAGHGRVHDPKDTDILNATRMKHTSDDELTGVESSDVLIAWLPGGRGTHVEIGSALALKKPVILCSAVPLVNEKPYPCSFYFHPGVRRLVEPDQRRRMGLAVAAVRELTMELRRPKPVVSTLEPIASQLIARGETLPTLLAKAKDQASYTSYYESPSAF